MDQKKAETLLSAMPEALNSTGAAFIGRCQALLETKGGDATLMAAQSLLSKNVMPHLESYSNLQKAGDGPAAKQALHKFQAGCTSLARQGHKTGVAIGQMVISLASQLQANGNGHSVNGHSHSAPSR